MSDKVKLTEKSIINKIFEGISENGWSLHNGMGTGNWNGVASNRSMIVPLVKYLKSKGIDVN